MSRITEMKSILNLVNTYFLEKEYQYKLKIKWVKGSTVYFEYRNTLYFISDNGTVSTPYDTEGDNVNISTIAQRVADILKGKKINYREYIDEETNQKILNL